MQNLRQQNGPTLTATAHAKPLAQGESADRSQSSSETHSAVHRPVGPAGYTEPGGSSCASGIRRQVRDTQSRDGDATTTSFVPGVDPRSQRRPTGSDAHATKHATSM